MALTSDECSVTSGDGVRLWTARAGAGPPLVLCHGGPGLWDAFEPLAEMVDDLVTVHRWDQRGSGRSERQGPYTVARFVADLEDLRSHFGHPAWVVGGHSWGATLALAYALTHPDRVRGLVYLSGSGIGRAWHGPYQAEVDRRRTLGQRQRLGALRDSVRSPEEETEYRALRWTPDFADRDRGVELAGRLARVAFEINHEANAALGAEVQTWDEADLAGRCRALSTPALLVHGAGDPRPAEAISSLAEALPLASVAVLPGVGHYPWLERPELLRTELRHFLASIP